MAEKMKTVQTTESLPDGSGLVDEGSNPLSPA